MAILFGVESAVPLLDGVREAGQERVMVTKPCHIVETTSPDAWRITENVLKNGGVVAFCTESTYGLGVALNRGPEPLERLALLKGRDGRKAFPLLGSTEETIEAFCDLSPELMRLGRTFWPGGLTVAGHPRGPVAPEVLSPSGTIGIRISSHPVARRVAELAGGIVTATSANLEGARPAICVEDLGTLVKGIDLVLDSGPAPGGPPSSVVGWGPEGLVVFREGALGKALLAKALLGEGPQGG